jgi:hypothetical protein
MVPERADLNSCDVLSLQVCGNIKADHFPHQPCSCFFLASSFLKYWKSAIRGFFRGFRPSSQGATLRFLRCGRIDKRCSLVLRERHMSLARRKTRMMQLKPLLHQTWTWKWETQPHGTSHPAIKPWTAGGDLHTAAGLRQAAPLSGR